MDKQLEELKKKLNELSQNSQRTQTSKKEKVPEPERIVLKPIPIPKPISVPEPIVAYEEEKEDDEELSPSDLEKLKRQMEKLEQKQYEQKHFQEEKIIEPTQMENFEKMQQLQTEIERLQNNGVFRAEILYQLVGINTNLEKIGRILDRRREY